MYQSRMSLKSVRAGLAKLACLGNGSRFQVLKNHVFVGILNMWFVPMKHLTFLRFNPRRYYMVKKLMLDMRTGWSKRCKIAAGANYITEAPSPCSRIPDSDTPAHGFQELSPRRFSNPGCSITAAESNSRRAIPHTRMHPVHLPLVGQQRRDRLLKGLCTVLCRESPMEDCDGLLSIHSAASRRAPIRDTPENPAPGPASGLRRVLETLLSCLLIMGGRKYTPGA
ncbi:hypothetical protein BJ508DRAFT_314216 [Ascobolus immersus RN42]|uniref:Uncharacterized protein n=1 Tax=Ascobolus immersus RN42 TaxID=1160509 RepID=A0A3N4HFV5_ASCIM|nr:hypothetical protein BJ508DRAFT_314216 [Ascobolus immersus RN42]